MEERTWFANRAELNRAVAEGRFTGRSMHLTVLHGALCSPEGCSCEPAFVVEPLTLETLREGERLQEEWEFQHGGAGASPSPRTNETDRRE